MSLADRELLSHVLSEIEVLDELFEKKSFDEVVNDKFLARTLVRCLEVIGEATRKLSDDFKSLHPVVAWREISDTRNKIIHDYSGIDYEIIRNIISNDIPELHFQIKKIILENSF